MPGRRPGSDEREVRQGAALRLAQATRIFLVPCAALAAAIAGAVFVVLLPICGIASLAEGFSGACWRAARDAAIASHRHAAKDPRMDVEQRLT